MSVAISMILDTRRAKRQNKYPIKLRINHLRVTNYYPTVYGLSEEDYQKLSATRVSQELQDIRDKLKKSERDAASLVARLQPFSFDVFERKFVLGNALYRQKRMKVLAVPDAEEDGFNYTPFLKKFPILKDTGVKQLSLSWAYQQYIRKLVREGRISSAVAYHCSYVSLKGFRGNVNLLEIKPAFLQAYERHALTNGLSKTTIGIYLR